jgi:restriction system protein
MPAIPEFESAEYLVTKKELRYRTLTTATRNKLYQQVVTQMALRTLRCVFAADRETKILEAVCNGYVDTIDTATGHDAHWCLVTVQVSRADFSRLDLARVDPVDCLAHLHAKISQTPEKYQPVQPIIEYPWDDLHYADELDAAAGLDTVKNLLDLDGYESAAPGHEPTGASTSSRSTRRRSSAGASPSRPSDTPPTTRWTSPRSGR